MAERIELVRELPLTNVGKIKSRNLRVILGKIAREAPVDTLRMPGGVDHGC